MGRAGHRALAVWGCHGCAALWCPLPARHVSIVAQVGHRGDRILAPSTCNGLCRGLSACNARQTEAVWMGLRPQSPVGCSSQCCLLPAQHTCTQFRQGNWEEGNPFRLPRCREQDGCASLTAVRHKRSCPSCASHHLPSHHHTGTSAQGSCSADAHLAVYLGIAEVVADIVQAGVLS